MWLDFQWQSVSVELRFGLGAGIDDFGSAAQGRSHRAVKMFHTRNHFCSNFNICWCSSPSRRLSSDCAANGS